MALGLYLSVPFCRTKCSYCNFASQVFAPARYQEYCALLAREIGLRAAASGAVGASVDTIYWGGGTPSLLPAQGFAEIVAALRRNFSLAPDCEHTVEAAPGTLSQPVIDAFLAAGVNRLSLGVQSFQDVEARAVGRLHRHDTVLADIERLRAAGLVNLNLDFIAGLPHQTLDSWQASLRAAVTTAVPHLSVYMLEVDEDSRLGSELLAGGTRYHAHQVPDEDLIADAYEWACEYLPGQGIVQYEISNFARPGSESRHNERYWLRRPYLGFGVDAHSFWADDRFANPDDLEAYSEPLRQNRLPALPPEAVTARAGLEETLFLGLRRSAGLRRGDLRRAAAVVPGYAAWLEPRLQSLASDGLLNLNDDRLALSPRGRLLSNRVFAEFLGGPAPERDTLTPCEDDSAPRA